MPNADKRAVFHPAPWAGEGWGDSDPFSGQAAYEEGFGAAVMPNFTRPLGPTGEATLFAAAGFEHVNRADQEQQSGIRVDRTEIETSRSILTPTSYLFQQPQGVQPSDWHSGVQLPDWMEA